jgi:hypothetical protein
MASYVPMTLSTRQKTTEIAVPELGPASLCRPDKHIRTSTIPDGVCGLVIGVAGHSRRELFPQHLRKIGP